MFGSMMANLYDELPIDLTIVSLMTLTSACLVFVENLKTDRDQISKLVTTLETL